MAEHDGRITLETKIDTGGIKNGKSTIKNAATEMGTAFAKQSKQIQAALNSSNAKVVQLANNFQKANMEIESQAKKVEELRQKLVRLESGEITVKDKGVEKLQTDFDKATASINRTQAEIDEIYMQLERLQTNAFKAPSGEIVLTPDEQETFSKLNLKLDELEPRLEANKKKAYELGEALKNATGYSTRKEIESTKSKLSQAELKLDSLKIKAQSAGQNLNNAMLGTDKAIKGTSFGLEKLGKRILRLGASALVFSAITKGFTLMRNHIGAALMSNDEFRASTYQLQAALWVVAEPIYQSILPGIQALIRWLTIGLLYIATFFNALKGKTLKEGIKSAKALQQQSEAYKNTAKSAGGATSANKKAARSMKELAKETKEANKHLADFDELMILSEDKLDDINTPSGSNTGNILSGFDGLEDLISESDMQKIQEFGKWVQQNAEPIRTALEITGYSLAALALGGFIKKIGEALGWFKKKDAGLDRQTKKTQTETDAVRELSNAWSLAPAFAYGLVPALDGLTESGKELIPTFQTATDVVYGLEPAFQTATNAATNFDATTEQVMPNVDTNVEKATSSAKSNINIFAEETDKTVEEWSGNTSSNVESATTNMAENTYNGLYSMNDNINTFVVATSLLFADWGVNLVKNNGDTIKKMANDWGTGLKTMWSNFYDFMVATGEKISGFWSEHKVAITTGIILTGLTVAGIALAPYTGGASLALPALAKGAVLPANQPFVAMLGDQKNGRNLEAPEGLIRQIFQEEMARMDYNGHGNTPVILELDGRELGRAIINAGKSEGRRLGTKVVYG